MTGRQGRIGRLEQSVFRTSEAAQAHGEAVVGRYLDIMEFVLGKQGQGRAPFDTVLAELPCADVYLHRLAMSEELERFLVSLLALVEQHAGEGAAREILQQAQEVER